jgi:hypothetical protein
LNDTNIFEHVKRTKTLVFTVTTGRSGTKYLTALLSGIAGVSAYHEPQPDFASYMRRCQKQPETAFAFWLHLKLPFIAAAPGSVYAETSHLFCKGFLEAAILLGLRPKLIILSRAPSQVAWSLFERNTIPARSDMGLKYLLSPEDPGVMPLPGWSGMTDYQLCFWYALEIERRQIRYSEFARRLTITTVEVLQRDLGNPQIFKHMLNGLDLPVDENAVRQHAAVSQTLHNKNPRSLQKPEDLESQESRVWQAIMSYEPLLADMVVEKYAPVGAAA